VLAWGLVTFVGRPAHTPPPPEFFADVISDAELSQITQGIRNAKPAEAPKPLVEKIADATPTENPNAKIVDKPEIVPTAEQLQPKPEPEKKPEPKKAEPKPPEPKPEPKQAFAKEEPKPDPIAEALKKDDTKPKKPEKKAETPPPKKQEPKQQPKFDSSRIAALLDKRDAQRRAATGSTLNNTPSLGAPTGQAATLSQNELDALRNRLRQCWNVPVGLAEARDLIVTVRIQFNKDGSLSAEPRLMNQVSHPAFTAASESALRAVRSCAPYSFLPVAKYEAWKDVIIDFDPRDMFRG
jgi:colicin import membrane protein